ncbi:transcriptional regulator [Komagataeibacter sp. FNDCR2]|uniref:transcriptional regulator n=1 Tax=Komagataeibacter sp. FNDCR2 TaxID=2878682 RepID=UPI00351D49BE|nr:helix-turn-helix domain-containing protein [Komagataeibacter sp. FNDCR2]
MTDIIDKAISRAGGLSALAKAIGIAPPSIIGWRYRAKIPEARIDCVHAATGIPREELRPDLFDGVTVVRATGQLVQGESGR